MFSHNEIYTDEECYRNFTSVSWSDLSNNDRLKALQEMENYMAEKQGREVPRTVKNEELPEDTYGKFTRENPNDLCIDLEQLKSESGYIAMYTIIHEGYHGYEYDVVNGNIQNHNFSEEEVKNLGKNFICYSEEGADYFFQPLEECAFSHADEMLSYEFRERFEAIDSEEYNLFLDNQREMQFEQKAKAFRDYDTLEHEQAKKDAIDTLNCKYEQMKVKLNEIQRLEDLKSKCTDEKRLEELEKDIEIEREHFDYPYDPEEALKQIETFERGEGVAITDKDPPKKDASYNLKSPHTPQKKQLKDLKQEFAENRQEIQAFKYRADQIEMRLKEIRNNEKRLDDLKNNRNNFPNTDRQINQLENSCEKAHEFFKREYNVKPENAPEMIENLRNQAVAKERDLKPTEEKIKNLQEQEKERQQIEKSVMDGQEKDEVFRGFDRAY